MGGPGRVVTGPTWGGCLEVLQWILTAGRFPKDPAVLEGAILLVETSEELPSAREVGYIPRSMNERGPMSAVDARPRGPTAGLKLTKTDRTPAQRGRQRTEQCETVIDVVGRYNPDAVVCAGIPFGHTRPQWILPHGGTMTIDSTTRRVTADYS